MGRDDVATINALSELRALVQACVEAHNGKVNDAKGDAILTEFASAVNAVSCAVEIQRQLHERNASLAAERRMQLRICVNLGDVIVKDDTVYGDGVNIAARLEALAEPGGICISRMIYENVKTRLPLNYASIGKKTMKNIAEPVEVFRILRDDAKGRRTPIRGRFVGLALAGMLIAFGAIVSIWRSSQTPTASDAPASGTTPKSPEAVSIAVLPFTNFSGEPNENWFSDGMTETLITDLSRLENLLVIARNSSFTYKGKAVDVRRVGQELGVRYVLEGSVQRTGDQLRINAQLLDAATGRHMWAERYDRTMADVFVVQDDIIQQIVTELDVTLLASEQARAWRKTTRNRQAYDLYLKAREHHDRGTRENVAKAQTLFKQALDLDPDFTMAMVWQG